MSDLALELASLASLDGVGEAVLVGEDGLLIEAAGDRDGDAELLAAMAPRALAAVADFSGAADLGDARTVVAECGRGVVVVRDIDGEVMLAVVAGDDVDVARLLHETRRAGDALGPLLR